MKTGPALITEINDTLVGPGHVAFWWLGQQSFVVKTRSAIIYLDPFLTPLEGRLIAPLLDPREVTNATLITGSHDHADHIDRTALPAIMAASPGAILVVPRVARESLVATGLSSERVRSLDNSKSLMVGPTKITGIAAAHEFLDYSESTGYPYLGYVIEVDGVTIYHAGDTCIYEGLATALKKWDMTVAFLPINGRDAKRYSSGYIGNMTYQEAVDLAGAIEPQLTVPAHFEMFSNNSEDPTLFAAYMDAKFPYLRYLICSHGESVFL